MNFFYTIVLAPAALLLGISGMLLNFVIETTIIGFAKFVTGTADGASGAVALAWGLIRDVLNMVFIFMLLYVGIGTILGSDKTSYQKAIPKIVFAGLVINFSFFFTSVLIDISNVVTVQLHKAIVDIGDTQPDANVPDTPLRIDGISGAFMHGLKLRVNDQQPDLGQKLVMMAMSFVVICVAAFVFLVMAAMLISRYIVLIILLITSPIAVMGGILPQLDGQAKKWWKELMDQLIFAPVLMLFMLIVVLIINSTGFHTAIRGSYSASGFFAETAGALLGYALVLGLMISGLITAKQFAGSAGGAFTDWASKKAGSLAFGGMAAAGAHSFGRAGKSFAESDYVNRLKGSDKLFAQKLGAGFSRFGTAAGTASYDLRGIDAIGKKAGAGKPASGYIGRFKQTEKEQKEAGEQIKKNVEERAKADLAKREAEEIKQLEAKLVSLRSGMMSKISPTLTEAERERVFNRTGAGAQYREAQARLNQLKKAKSEEAIREEAVAATKGVSRADIGHINAVLDDPTIKKITDPAERQEKILQRLDANERRYWLAMEDLVSLEKRKVAQERIYKEQWAMGASNSWSKGERDTADKMRKELNKNKQAKAWDALKDALKAEGVAVDETGSAAGGAAGGAEGQGGQAGADKGGGDKGTDKTT